MSRIARLAVTLLVSVSSTVLTAAIIGEPAWADDDHVLHTHYDGVTNDLLTAGLGALGLQSATAPAIADPLHPTKEELRRLAIYNNYRALVDISTGGGFTVLYGPNVKPDGTAQDPSTHKGLIAGDEYLAFEKGDDGRTHVTMMVQIPDSFDPTNSCIVAAPSSGSRGVYGAIATAAEWEPPARLTSYRSGKRELRSRKNANRCAGIFRRSEPYSAGVEVVGGQSIANLG